MTSLYMIIILYHMDILRRDDTGDITKTDKTNHGCLGVLCI